MRPGDGGRGLRDVAVRTLDRDPSLELLVYGHSHVRALERVVAGGVYANPGAWLSEPTYLCVDDAAVAAFRWDDSAGEGERLDVLERRAEEVGRGP
jgi:predicted phosphodiesterase